MHLCLHDNETIAAVASQHTIDSNPYGSLAKPNYHVQPWFLPVAYKLHVQDPARLHHGLIAVKAAQICPVQCLSASLLLLANR